MAEIAWELPDTSWELTDADGLSAEVGIDDSDEEVGLPEKKGGLAAVGTGAAVVGEVEAGGRCGKCRVTSVKWKILRHLS